jgi:hypothetical protein
MKIVLDVDYCRGWYYVIAWKDAFTSSQVKGRFKYRTIKRAIKKLDLRTIKVLVVK